MEAVITLFTRWKYQWDIGPMTLNLRIHYTNRLKWLRYWKRRIFWRKNNSYKYLMKKELRFFTIESISEIKVSQIHTLKFNIILRPPRKIIWCWNINHKPLTVEYKIKCQLPNPEQCLKELQWEKSREKP